MPMSSSISAVAKDQGASAIGNFDYIGVVTTTVNSGATSSGANLKAFDVSTPPGTWRNISAANMTAGPFNVMQRVA